MADPNELEEVYSIFDELMTLLETDDIEFHKLKSSARAQESLNQLWRKQENGIKEDIIGLTNVYEEEKGLSEKPNYKGQQEEADKIRDDLQRDISHKEDLGSQVDSLKNESERLQTEREELQQERERIENETTKVIPAIRHDLNLFNYVTRLRWQYDCPTDEIKGYVANKKQVKPFSLNTKQNSQFFITNHLWDLMENEWD